MRCLFIYYMHKPGGLCTRLYRAMNALASRERAVLYLTLDQPPDGKVDDRVVVHLIPFPLRRRKGLLFWALFTTWIPLYLCFASLRFRPERMIAFGAYYATVSYLASRVCGARVVLFMRSLVFRNDQLTGKAGWLRYCTECVERFGIRSADLVVCMTEAMLVDVSIFARRQLTATSVLRNDLPNSGAFRAGAAASEPLTPAAALCRSGGGVLLVTAGVLDKRKNIGVLIDAMAIIRQHQPPIDCHLMIVGDGGDRSVLEAQVASYQLDNVSFFGWAETATCAIGQASLLLHPALHEGMANVVLEALAQDVPVLLSDIPEHRELLGKQGVCVSPTEAKDWAESILSFVNDDSYRTGVKESSKQARTMLSFDWDSEFSAIVENP